MARTGVVTAPRRAVNNRHDTTEHLVPVTVLVVSASRTLGVPELWTRCIRTRRQVTDGLGYRINRQIRITENRYRVIGNTQMTLQI